MPFWYNTHLINDRRLPDFGCALGVVNVFAVLLCREINDEVLLPVK